MQTIHKLCHDFMDFFMHNTLLCLTEQYAVYLNSLLFISSLFVYVKLCNLYVNCAFYM